MKIIFNFFSVLSFLFLFSVSSFATDRIPAEGIEPNAAMVSGGAGSTAIGIDCPTGTCFGMQTSGRAKILGDQTTIFRSNGPVKHNDTSAPVDIGQ